mgnify:CR=1 FL=1
MYVTIQVLCEYVYFLHFCKTRTKFTSMAGFFSKLSKRQRNPVENFKTQSGRGGGDFTVEKVFCSEALD